jgi:ankyrin repeat protein
MKALYDWINARSGGSNDVEATRQLILRNVNVDLLNDDFETPLHITAISGSAAAAKMLIEAGANLSAKDKEWNMTPLHKACSEEQNEIVKIFLQAGANIEAKDSDEWTPLLAVAFTHGNVETAKLLLDAGANIYTRGETSETPLHAASIKGNADLIKLLIERGASIESTDADGDTPLHVAAAHSLNSVKALLKAGADIEARAHDGSTPLQKCCSHIGDASKWRLEIAKYLIDMGADPEAMDARGLRATEVDVTGDVGRYVKSKLLEGKISEAFSDDEMDKDSKVNAPAQKHNSAGPSI